ncbi:MAG: right-handed parallel beta-helix repeat-containing protein [Planctomycetia bacterium]|nr:right-handed parallel beta-helix repeat-containing protein [Planctomycetia bacterium]
MARAWFGGRRMGNPARRRSDAVSRVRTNPFHHRLRLEPLEDRRMLTAFLVNSLSDAVAADGVITLREALEAANTNAAVFDARAGSDAETDVITFAPELFTDGTDPLPGKIVFEPGNADLLITDPAGVEIQGPGAELLSINANQQSRVFYVNSGVVASLLGMTVTGGSADRGGGIYSSGTLTITNSTLAGNSSSYGGGGIYSFGTLTLTNSTLSGNSASDEGGIYASDGGGIYNGWHGTLTLTNSTLSGNSTSGCGGGIISSGTISITDSTISDNSAGGGGGGIYNNYVGTLTITDSTLSGNSAGGGGGIYNSGTLAIATSTLSGNSGSGGGINNVGYNGTASVTITNSTLSGNLGGTGTGGIASFDSYNGTATLTITNSTLSRNSPVGIFSYGSSTRVTLNNTIVAGNLGDIYQLSGVLSGCYNLIGDGTGQSSLVDGIDGNQVGTSSSPIDPLFVRNPSPGDPGDLRLLAGSPAINMGSNALAVDAAGHALIADLDNKDRVIYDTVDIGAYEYRLTGDANLDAVVDDKDASILGAHWRQQAGATWADGDFNADGKVDDRDAAILAAHWGEQIVVGAGAEGAGVGTEGTGASRGVIGPKAAAPSPGGRRVIEPRPVEAAGAAGRVARDMALAEGIGGDEVLACRLAWSHENARSRGRVAGHVAIVEPPEAVLLIPGA